MNGEDGNFEEPILKLRRRIEELSALPDDAAHRREIEKLRERLDRVSREIYGNLTPWQKTLVARHPLRPYTADYIGALTNDFVELHGDRRFADDPAVVAGLAHFRGIPVAIVGHQKGRDTKEKIRRNFGMPRPEGYRKALRVMQMAEKFGRPILTFLDVVGAYPGMDAEERGQAEAIAVNLREMAAFRVPIVVTVTGEGGSGGALAIGIGDRVLMMEH
ncbi:MAG TPA: acetyl-CoA carboxylase carboxyl transferase subunit alpha, partial [Thermoanaerobaculia bacterium]